MGRYRAARGKSNVEYFSLTRAMLHRLYTRQICLFVCRVPVCAGCLCVRVCVSEFDDDLIRHFCIIDHSK